MEINNPLREGLSGFMMALEAQKSAAETMLKPVDVQTQKGVVPPQSQDQDNRELPQAVTGVESTVDLIV